MQPTGPDVECSVARGRKLQRCPAVTGEPADPDVGSEVPGDVGSQVESNGRSGFPARDGAGERSRVEGVCVGEIHVGDQLLLHVEERGSGKAHYRERVRGRHHHERLQVDGHLATGERRRDARDGAVAVEEERAWQLRQELILLFIIVQLAALTGAFALARPTDRWGAKKVINLTLLLWTGVVVGAYFVQTKPVFFVLAVAAGFGLGSVQAASRSLMAALIPPGKEAEMFGFYALCGKSSSILGPVVFGQVSLAFGGNQRVAVLALGAFFLTGLILLQRVRVPGRAARNA